MLSERPDRLASGRIALGIVEAPIDSGLHSRWRKTLPVGIAHGRTSCHIRQRNPFPFALLRQPPRGGMAEVMYDISYSDLHHPSAYAFFGDADVVMYPNENMAGIYWEGLVKTYEADLHVLFEPVAESDLWILYGRRD
jgi:hypothetical protein